MTKLAQSAARILSWISVAAVVFVTVATLIDIVGRYFNVPLHGSFEMIQIAMIFLIFSALPAVTMQREHVTVDLVQANLPALLRRLTFVFVGIVGAGTCIFYAVQLWARGQYLQRTAEVTSNLSIPVFPFAIFIAAMWILTALCFAVLVVEDIHRLRSQSGDV